MPLTDHNDIAHRVMLRMASTVSGYQLSPEAFDIAMSCSFLDASQLSLQSALACQIASEAEPFLEEGLPYNVGLDVIRFKNARLRLNYVLNKGGYEALREEILGNKHLKRKFKYYNDSYTDFLEGWNPTHPSEDDFVYHTALEAYRKCVKSNLIPSLDSMLKSRDLTRLVIGILRDLGLDLLQSEGEYNLLDITVDTTKHSSETQSVKVNGKVFYEVDAVSVDPDLLEPKEVQASEKFLKTLGAPRFLIPTKPAALNLDSIAGFLQEINAYLNHPVKETRAECESWLRKRLEASILSAVERGKVGTPLKRASRGFLRRFLKGSGDETDWDSGADAKKYFGKDTVMLLRKAWNKTALKTNFGEFQMPSQAEKWFFDAIQRRLSPKGYSYRNNLRDDVLVDIICAVMFACVLKKLGIKVSVDYDRILEVSSTWRVLPKR